MAQSSKIEKRARRKIGIRKRISGTAEVPRISVYKSINHIYAQAIDDVDQKTVANSSDVKEKKGKKIESAKNIGIELAKDLTKKKITKAVFDRSGYKYHGRIAAIAEGLREGGIKI